MANDQQFCLRWNNHQSTLISVFDSLLENETLVDCTLAAEGQSLKAHKVVLSACSPYLESLLSKHYEKHPILILKDVKFTELKSMMDYMYRGEVNICQDQLGTFLKAAESLQIKGLSDNGDEAVGTSSAAPKKDPPRPSVTQTTRTPVESKRPAPPGDSSDASRDGSISPSSLRKRRRTRRPSQGDEVNHLDSNCDTAQTAPIVPAVTVPAPVKQIVKQEPNLSINETGLKKEIIEPPNEPLLEPKTEYLDYMNNENSIEVEDLTLDDDDDLDSSMDASRPGPSHGDMSNQGYPAWPMGDQSGTDEIFMAAQEAVGAATGQQQRDSQGGEDEKIKEEPQEEILLEEVEEEEFVDMEVKVELIEGGASGESSLDPFQDSSQAGPTGISHQPIILNNHYSQEELIVPDVLDEENVKHPRAGPSTKPNTVTSKMAKSSMNPSNVTKTTQSLTTGETSSAKKSYDVSELFECKERPRFLVKGKSSDSAEKKQLNLSKKKMLELQKYRKILPAKSADENPSSLVEINQAQNKTRNEPIPSTILSVPCNPLSKTTTCQSNFVPVSLQSSSVSNLTLSTQSGFAIATTQISQQIATSQANQIMNQFQPNLIQSSQDPSLGNQIVNQFQIPSSNIVQTPQANSIGNQMLNQFQVSSSNLIQSSQDPSLGSQIVNKFQIPSSNIVQSPQPTSIGNQMLNQFQISSPNFIRSPQDQPIFFKSMDPGVNLLPLGGVFLGPNTCQYTSPQLVPQSTGANAMNSQASVEQKSSPQASVPKVVKFPNLAMRSRLQKISPQALQTARPPGSKPAARVPPKPVKILPKP